ncbi:transposase [Streptococcus salivarius]
MTQFTTELLNFLTSLETAMNDLLQAELSAFLGYEPYEKVGYNSGNSRNGSYARKFETKYGTVQLTIPRDRNGNFSPALLPAYGRRDDHLEEMVIKLYQTGVTTREISDIIERMYGHHYSPATISNISKATQENVAAFHERSLEANYSVLFLDGTYLPLRDVEPLVKNVFISHLALHQKDRRLFLDMKSPQMKTMLLGPPC